MLFIVGYHASGKTDLANMFTEQYGALHVETSAVVRGFKALDNPDAEMGQWAAEKEAQYGINFFDDIIVDAVRGAYIDVLEKGGTPQEVVITGNRALTGVQYIAEQLSGLHDRPSSVIAVEVSDEQRYRRYKERDRRPGDADISFEDFGDLIRQERDTGLDEIFAYADYIVSNNDSREVFMQEGHALASKELGLRRLTMEGEDLNIHGEGNGFNR